MTARSRQPGRPWRPRPGEPLRQAVMTADRRAAPARRGRATSRAAPTVRQRPGLGHRRTSCRSIRIRVQAHRARRRVPLVTRLAGQWWRHAEAITRLTALWQSWEAMRLPPARDANWLRDYLGLQLPSRSAAADPARARRMSASTARSPGPPGGQITGSGTRQSSPTDGCAAGVIPERDPDTQRTRCAPDAAGQHGSRTARSRRPAQTISSPSCSVAAARSASARRTSTSSRASRQPTSRPPAGGRPETTPPAPSSPVPAMARGEASD